MKRAGHLIEKIADFENLQLAYYKAQKGKADKSEVREYEKRLQANLQNLQAQILSSEAETGHYHYFTIYDPKKRLICAAPFGQRVLHHALMNVCHPFFANHYLAGADHYVKEVLPIKAFVRYMDDSVLWHNDKEILFDAGLRLEQHSAAELKLTLKPFCLNRNSHGLPFLGYLLYPERTRLAPRSRKRFVKKLRLYADNLVTGAWTQKEYQDHVLPLIAFTEHAAAKEFRKKVIAQV